MNTDSSNLCYEEYFPTLGSSNFFNDDDESRSNEDEYRSSFDENVWEWEVERELNGDIAIIPMSSGVGMNYLSTSPPIKDDFHKIMNEWQQQFVNTEVSDMELFMNDMPLSVDEDEISISPSSSWNLIDSINSIDKKPIIKMPHSIGKKIDMDAQCYVIDKKESNDDNKIVVDISKIKLETSDKALENYNVDKIEVKKDDIENDYVDVDTIDEHGTPILQAGDLDTLLEQFEATETIKCLEPVDKLSSEKELCKLASVQNSSENIKNIQVANEQESCDKNEQILNALPRELIMRIKASSKRRIVPVIDAIPNKRRYIKKIQSTVDNTSQVAEESVEKIINTECIKLDHDYCSQPTPYPKYPKKDSGFESAEEDEQRNILRNQPTVKGANGKLMVSLLKVNTIRNNSTTEITEKRRKLNLEEYKKRREGFTRSRDNSQNNSPANSGRNSPVIIEDEQSRLLRHQQKLMQMAADVLNTPPKSARKIETSTATTSETTTLPVVSIETLPRCVPLENIEVKVLVSIGVNTDIIGISKKCDIVKKELEEIKPILKNAISKINNNSLITSVIENIQSNGISNKHKSIKMNVQSSKTFRTQEEHGEDKTIVYLDKCRPTVVTNEIEIQTNLDVENVIKYKRKRNSDSSEHRKSYKRRSSSSESVYSHASSSSDTSYSSFRSRSPSPKRISYKKRNNEKDSERIREVEERRIVYVGGISSSMTKEILHKRFRVFGPISNVSVHFRVYGDNYGFVTFVNKRDAYEAVEHGNDDPTLDRYDLSFGGRRIFCRTHYADLDNVRDDLAYSSSNTDNSFDSLLREVQAKLRKRKTST